MMQKNYLIVTILLVAIASSLLVSKAKAQSQFGSTRPGSPIYEPTLSFIRQNMRLVNHYIALFRSIFVGAYERPLVTSTDPPPGAIRVKPPVVPPMDLPTKH